MQTLKIILGYLLIHYDLEPMLERPKFLHVGSASMVKADTKIRLRRRPSPDEASAAEKTER